MTSQEVAYRQAALMAEYLRASRITNDVVHHLSCPRAQFWDAGEYECPCLCPKGWPRRMP